MIALHSCLTTSIKRVPREFLISILYRLGVKLFNLCAEWVNRIGTPCRQTLVIRFGQQLMIKAIHRSRNGQIRGVPNEIHHVTDDAARRVIDTKSQFRIAQVRTLGERQRVIQIAQKGAIFGLLRRSSCALACKIMSEDGIPVRIMGTSVSLSKSLSQLATVCRM